MNIFRFFLFPLSGVYYLISKLRNVFYAKGIFKTAKIPKPVISIGNITTGGTGKTPLAVFIADFFMGKGYVPAVISRGYGRNSTIPILVYDGEKITCEVDMSGDELYMISEELMKKHKKFYVMADSNRVRGMESLLDEFKIDILILDDAFQNRKIERDLNLLLVDGVDYSKGKLASKVLLPAGNLRETKNGIERSDLIIQNNKTEKLEVIPGLKQYKKDIVIMNYEYEGIFDGDGNEIGNEQRDVIAISGLASPNSFYKMIETNGMKINKKLKYPDHYNYVHKDIRDFTKFYEKECVFITTYKDYVKLKEFINFIKEYPVYYIKIGLDFDDNYNILEAKLNSLV